MRLATALLVVMPAMSGAQQYARRIELVGTATGELGVSRLHLADENHVALQGGIRVDGAIQARLFALGLGFRFYQIAPTQTFGGEGVDGFVSLELRQQDGDRSILRFALGGGFADVDAGKGDTIATTIDNGSANGVMFSIGVAREIASSQERPVLSLELLFPNVNPGSFGRRAPVLLFGLGFRRRSYVSIGIPATTPAPVPSR